jgi:hypothetical protein
MPKQSKREMSDKLRSGSHNEGVIIGQPTVEAHSTVGATRVTSFGSYTILLRRRNLKKCIRQVIIKISFFWSSSYEGAITLGTY